MIATTGRIPTTTVSASSTRAMPAMSDSIRPMNESTSSSAGDVDQHAARAGLRDPLREVLLQRHRHPVVHVDLDADQQQVPELEDRDAVGAVTALARRRARRRVIW